MDGPKNRRFRRRPKESFLDDDEAASGDPVLRDLLDVGLSPSLQPSGSKTSNFTTNAPGRRQLCAQTGGIEANSPDARSVVLAVDTSSVMIEGVKRESCTY